MGMAIAYVRIKIKETITKPTVGRSSVPNEIESSPRPISGHIRSSILLIRPELALRSFTSALHSLDEVSHRIGWDRALLNDVALLVLSTGRAIFEIPLEITRSKDTRWGTLYPILNTLQMLFLYAYVPYVNVAIDMATYIFLAVCADFIHTVHLTDQA